MLSSLDNMKPLRAVRSYKKKVTQTKMQIMYLRDVKLVTNR